MDEYSPFSAQVVVALPSGTEDIEDIRISFRDLGFDVGHFAGSSFAISAPLRDFIRVFGKDSPGSAAAAMTEASAFDAWVEQVQHAGRLPDTGLPESIRRRVSDILVTRRPDFGP